MLRKILRNIQRLITIFRFLDNNLVEPMEMRRYLGLSFFNMDELVSNTNISPTDYKDLYPLFLFDVSKQSEKLKYSRINIQNKVYFDYNVNAGTEAYTVIISDRLINFQSNGNRLYVVI